MNTFRPRLDVLPPVQRALWPALAPTVGLGFALYGGTAIALRLGHRPSVDFDFFTESRLDRMAIGKGLSFVARSLVLQDEPDAWTMLVPESEGARTGVKVSFFGGIAFGRVGAPERTEDGVLVAASVIDLLATKLKVMLQRAEAKDYRDVATLLESGASLPHGLAAAAALYGDSFQPSESLRALVFFGDGDLASLTEREKVMLVDAASAVRELPEIRVLSRVLGADRARPEDGPGRGR